MPISYPHAYYCACCVFLVDVCSGRDFVRVANFNSLEPIPSLLQSDARMLCLTVPRMMPEGLVRPLACTPRLSARLSAPSSMPCDPCPVIVFPHAGEPSWCGTQSCVLHQGRAWCGPGEGLVKSLGQPRLLLLLLKLPDKTPAHLP